MAPPLFWTFSAIMLLFGLMVIISRNLVTSALSLVVCFLGLAALYVSLDAFFIGVIQVLVYAGAVIVLFLFVIMLLDLKAEERRKVRSFGGKVLLVGGPVCVLALVALFLASLANSPLHMEAAPTLEGATIPLGKLLFTEYSLPFEIVSVLLLVAMVGVVLLSKKDLK